MTRARTPFLAFVLSLVSLACASDPKSSAAPVSAGRPNVPENRPAFPEQTRAPQVKTQTPLQVTEIASGFNLPGPLRSSPTAASWSPRSRPDTYSL